MHSSYSVVWHLHFRLILSTALGTAVTLALLAVPWRTPTRVLLGWDAGVGLYLALTYGVMANASIAKIRQRAAIVDEGALAVLVLTTAAALASLSTSAGSTSSFRNLADWILWPICRANAASSIVGGGPLGSVLKRSNGLCAG